MERFNERLKKCILAAFRLVRIELSEARAETLVQFVKFCCIGVTNTAVNYGIYVLVLALLRRFELSWDYIAGNTVAFFLSVLWSFCWNSRFVFSLKGKRKTDWLKALLKTYISYAFTGIVLNNILSAVWIDMLGLSKYVAPLLNLVISTPVNFLINKKWAFRAE